MANALLKAVIRSRIVEAKALALLDRLVELPIEVDADDSFDAIRRSWALARLHTLTAYDARYLELAIRRGLPLATFDEKLAAAAGAAGVRLLVAAP